MNYQDVPMITFLFLIVMTVTGIALVNGTSWAQTDMLRHHAFASMKNLE